MVCRSPKNLGPTKSSMSIGPFINLKYSIGPLTSDVFIRINQYDRSDWITIEIKTIVRQFFSNS